MICRRLFGLPVCRRLTVEDEGFSYAGDLVVRQWWVVSGINFRIFHSSFLPHTSRQSTFKRKTTEIGSVQCWRNAKTSKSKTHRMPYHAIPTSLWERNMWKLIANQLYVRWIGMEEKKRYWRGEIAMGIFINFYSTHRTSNSTSADCWSRLVQRLCVDFIILICSTSTCNSIANRIKSCECESSDG